MDFSPFRQKNQIWPKCLCPRPPKFAQDVIPVNVTLGLFYNTFYSLGLTSVPTLENEWCAKNTAVANTFHFFLDKARRHPVLYQNVFIGFSNPFIVSITGTAWEIISQIKTKGGLLLQNLVLRWQKIKAIKMSLSCILEKNSKRERTHIFSVFFFFTFL